VPLIVDSSVAVSWMIADEDSEAGRRALALAYAEGIIGPRVLWYEVRNSLIVNERRGGLLPSETEQALSVFADLEPIFIDDHDEPELLRLSRKHRLTVYDSAYLELAKRLGQTLATFDGALAEAAIAEGVDVIG
jgi:predicted nucleic acid-binding protein